MTHSDLLELVATALSWKVHHTPYAPRWIMDPSWNPIQVNNDAFEVLALLQISIEYDSAVCIYEGSDYNDYEYGVEVWFVACVKEKVVSLNHTELYNDHRKDPIATARMAIVVLAAKLGEVIKGCAT